MPKYSLETRKITYYTVIIEADSIEAAEAQVREWVSDDFEPLENSGTEWIDGEWEPVEEVDA